MGGWAASFTHPPEASVITSTSRIMIKGKDLKMIRIGNRLLCVGMLGFATLSYSQEPRPVRTQGGLSPKPVITSIETHDDQVTIKWRGLAGPYQVQRLVNLVMDEWTPAGEQTVDQSITMTREAASAFFAVQGPTPLYAGAESCKLCHAETYNHWQDTLHAHALDTLKAIGQDQNSRCLACHTVGYGMSSGFIDEAITPHLAGVQCENCHGPSGAHAANPFEIEPPKVELASEMCGGCHSGFHHSTYDEWHLSNHGNALSTLQHGFSRESCLECHSEDYRYAKEHNLPTPTVATARLSLECSTCHEAHGGAPERHQLKKPLSMLCGECHTVGEPRLGSTPHHPQFEMLKGLGMYDFDGSPLELRGPHTRLSNEGGQSCAQCHMVKYEPASVNQGNPVVTGHTFNPFDETIPSHLPTQYQGCAPCHSPTGGDFRRKDTQNKIRELLNLVGTYFTPENPNYINPSTLPPLEKQLYDSAKFNWQYVEADKSLGVHNPPAAEVGLRASEWILKGLSQID